MIFNRKNDPKLSPFYNSTDKEINYLEVIMKYWMPIVLSLFLLSGCVEEIKPVEEESIGEKDSTSIPRPTPSPTPPIVVIPPVPKPVPPIVVIPPAPKPVPPVVVVPPAPAPVPPVVVVPPAPAPVPPVVVVPPTPAPVPPVVVVPPAPKPTTPVLISAILSDKDYILKWSLAKTDLGSPMGGFDTFVDDMDQNDHVKNDLIQRISNLDITKKHCFKVQARWRQLDPSVFLFSNEICVDAIAAPAPVPVPVPPVVVVPPTPKPEPVPPIVVIPPIVVGDTSALSLFNFRIQNANKNRIYFDSTQNLTGSSVAGFVVSGKRISAVRIIAGKQTGHYFTVSAAFDFWDNNTIRYSSGSNLKDSEGKALSAFDLEYIKNYIPEPIGSGKKYYISRSGNDSRNGESAANAWRSISKASIAAKAGDTVYIQAGNYGDQSIVCRNSGTANNPVKFIGYKSTPGDIKSMYYAYGDGALDPSEMPLIDGGNGTGYGIQINCKYSVMRNIQVTNYELGINSKGSKSLYDNLIITKSEVRGIDIRGDLNSYARITNSIVISAKNSMVRIYNHFNLIENIKVYEDSSVSNPADYYLSFRGNFNIIRNSSAEKVGTLAHTGHGMSLKGSGFQIEYNLMENLEIIGIKKSLEARHDEVRYNVYRNIKIYRKKTEKFQTGGIAILNGASYNIFDKITVDDMGMGILFAASTEDITAKDIGNNNLIKNSIFTNNDSVILSKSDNSGQNRKAYQNTIANSTFHNNSILFIQGSKFVEDNKFINCSFSKTGREKVYNDRAIGFSYEYSNFFNNGFATPKGEGNISVDPEFVDEARGDFRLSRGSQCIDAGKDLDYVRRDYDRIARPQGRRADIGAFEFK